MQPGTAPSAAAGEPRRRGGEASGRAPGVRAFGQLVLELARLAVYRDGVNPLIRLIPPGLVRVFARPYVAGDSLGAGVDAAARLMEKRGLHATLDLLAEDIERQEMAQRNLDTYLSMVDLVASDPRFNEASRPTVSLKLSSYTTAPLEDGGDAAGARAAAFQIAERAKERGVQLSIDMEGRAWTDFTLDTLAELHRAGYDHVGAVIQTRLNRTREDLDRLPPRCRVRLVIGIYHEPESVATTDKREMKQRMLDYAAVLLERVQVHLEHRQYTAYLEALVEQRTRSLDEARRQAQLLLDGKDWSV